MQTILVKEIIGLQGLTLEDGDNLYNVILPPIENGDSILLDFSGIGEVTTAFFNMAVGRLYADFASEILQQRLHIENLTTPGIKALNRSIENARSYYKRD